MRLASCERALILEEAAPILEKLLLVRARAAPLWSDANEASGNWSGMRARDDRLGRGASVDCLCPQRVAKRPEIFCGHRKKSRSSVHFDSQDSWPCRWRKRTRRLAFLIWVYKRPHKKPKNNESLRIEEEWRLYRSHRNLLIDLQTAGQS